MWRACLLRHRRSSDTTRGPSGGWRGLTPAVGGGQASSSVCIADCGPRPRHGLRERTPRGRRQTPIEMDHEPLIPPKALAQDRFGQPGSPNDDREGWRTFPSKPQQNRLKIASARVGHDGAPPAFWPNSCHGGNPILSYKSWGAGAPGLWLVGNSRTDRLGFLLPLLAKPIRFPR